MSRHSAPVCPRTKARRHGSVTSKDSAQGGRYRSPSLRRVRLFVRLPQFKLCVKMRYRARTNFGFCWWACVMRPTVCRYDLNRRSLLAFLALISACLIPIFVIAQPPSTGGPPPSGDLRFRQDHNSTKTGVVISMKNDWKRRCALRLV